MSRVALGVFFCFSFSLAAQEDTSASRIPAMNRALTARSEPRASEDALLRSRSTMLRDLIASDPAKSLEVAFDEFTAAQFRSLYPDAGVENVAGWEGQATALVFDDFEHGRSATRWYLQTAAEKFEIYFAHAAPRSGSRVRLKGISVGAASQWTGSRCCPQRRGRLRMCSRSLLRSSARRRAIRRLR